MCCVRTHTTRPHRTTLATAACTPYHTRRALQSRHVLSPHPMPLRVVISKDPATQGREAAAFVVDAVKAAVAAKGEARMIWSTGASQFDFVKAVVETKDMPWGKITSFHLDEYCDLDETHPASFRKYLRDRLFDLVSPKPKAVHLVDPSDAGIEAYSKLLMEGDIDVACIGIGENGHIAFNDPPVADFDDPLVVKKVAMDEACRKQQVGEGWFASIDETPAHAATLTVPAIMRAKVISCVTPDFRKAEAVKNTLGGPIATSCPASVLRRHDNCVLHLDPESSSTVPADVLSAFSVTYGEGAEAAVAAKAGEASGAGAGSA